jgi:hypothetical protein
MNSAMMWAVTDETVDCTKAVASGVFTNNAPQA